MKNNFLKDKNLKSIPEKSFFLESFNRLSFLVSTAVIIAISGCQINIQTRQLSPSLGNTMVRLGQTQARHLEDRPVAEDNWLETEILKIQKEITETIDFNERKKKLDYLQQLLEIRNSQIVDNKTDFLQWIDFNLKAKGQFKFLIGDASGSYNLDSWHIKAIIEELNSYTILLKMKHHKRKRYFKKIKFNFYYNGVFLKLITDSGQVYSSVVNRGKVIIFKDVNVYGWKLDLQFEFAERYNRWRKN